MEIIEGLYQAFLDRHRPGGYLELLDSVERLGEFFKATSTPTLSPSVGCRWPLPCRSCHRVKAGGRYARSLATEFPQSDILVVSDSWFGNDGFWTPMRRELGGRVQMLSRFRSNNNPCGGKKPPELLPEGHFAYLDLRLSPGENALSTTCGQRPQPFFTFFDVRRLVDQAALNQNFTILCPAPRKSVVNTLVIALMWMAA